MKSNTNTLPPIADSNHETPPPVAPTPAPAPERKPVVVAFTGRMKIGKDFVARAIGAELHGLADPLYKLCEFFFGSSDKDIPGMRACMQQLGQWGRRHIVEPGYALTPERGLVQAVIRSQGQQMAPGMEVEWSRYGLDQDIWLNALFRRIAKSSAPVKAITNVRFVNEFKRCQEEGCILLHVMCSKPTYEERLKRAGMPLDHPSLRDTSEQLARELDQQVVNAVTRQAKGAKMLCVWSDPHLPPPSPRIMTIAEATEYVNKQTVLNENRN